MTARLRRDYRRRRPSKDPEPAILVVTEGKKTEPEYLGSLRRRLHLATAAVVVCPADGTDPGSIVDCAISIRKQRRDEAGQGDVVEYSETWIVFDSEQRLGTPALSNALTKALQQGLRVALSAPCFEYWLVLHFEYTTSLMYTCREVERRLKRHIPDYDKSSPPMAVLIPKVAIAVGHAEKCRIEQEKADAPLPRTGVDQLVRAMNDAAREHYRLL